MGWGLSSRVGEPPGLCFKVGIKQYYSGFHAEFLASGEGQRTRSGGKLGWSSIPSFCQQGLLVGARWDEGAKIESISMAAQLHPK